MTNLADFLRARYAERRAIAEAAASKARSGDWRYKAGDDCVHVVEIFPESPPAQRELWSPLVTEAGSYVGDTLDDEIGWHIAANNPADVLADLDAKLAIVDAYLPPDADVHPGLPCINFKGQDPTDYSEYDSCSRHLEAAP
ncbi:DUF6221 family protein [Streptomyces globisporus]|uniref:DUF6221 family protein n=1 Tax=Streptomyces globisporus TaxID=1908 RepID=UPI00345F1D6D|nr:DUF6221 family protein [Streptomyces globisporus]